VSGASPKIEELLAEVKRLREEVREAKAEGAQQMAEAVNAVLDAAGVPSVVGGHGAVEIALSRILAWDTEQRRSRRGERT